MRKPRPRTSLWVVYDSYGGMEGIYDSRREAEKHCLGWLGPYTVRRYRLVAMGGR